MSKTIKKSLALLISAVLMFSVFSPAISVYASESVQEEQGLTSRFRTGRTLAKIFNGILEGLISGILGLFPNPPFEHIDDYTPNTDFKGNADFSDEATAEFWRAGYSSKSVIPADISKGYNMAGFFNGAVAKSVYEGDDQRFSAVALDAGDGIALFCSLDGFGMTGTNIKALRENLADFAEENNIISINITLTHTHYALDVHGLGMDVGELLKANFKNIFTRKAELKNSVNDTLFSLLLSQSKAAVIEAVDSMSEGTLSYGAADISDLIRDKQNPIAFDPNVNQIKFVPADGNENEIWLVNMGVHPTSLSRDEDKVSSDYAGAIVRYAKEVAGADVAFYQGAGAGLTKETGPLNMPAGTDGFTEAKIYGEEIVDRILTIDNYTEIEPYMNIVHKEILVPVTNAMLWTVCKLQLANNQCIMTSRRIQDARAATEIGYCELGSELAIIMMPGEASAEIIFGGTKPASIAWNEVDWEYAPLKDFTGGRTTIAFGLTNDQVGYIVPDNDYANTFADMLFSDYYGDNNSHYEEFLSLGKQTASTLTSNFIEMIEEVR